MKTVMQSTLLFTVAVMGVPSTAAEYDEMAKEPGACLEDAVSNAIYRGWLNTFRSKCVEALAGTFKEVCPRKSETSTDEKGKVTEVFEKDKLYVTRLQATLTALPEYGAEGATKAMQEVADRVAASLPFTLDTVRTGGKVSQEFLTAADSIIEAVEAGGGDYTKFVSNITSFLPSFTFTFDESGKPTRDSIGLALRARMEQKKKEAKNELASLV